MKDKTMAYMMYIALGLVAISLCIVTLWPVVSDSIRDVNSKKPTVPTTLQGP